MRARVDIFVGVDLVRLRGGLSRRSGTRGCRLGRRLRAVSRARRGSRAALRRGARGIGRLRKGGQPAKEKKNEGESVQAHRRNSPYSFVFLFNRTPAQCIVRKSSRLTVSAISKLGVEKLSTGSTAGHHPGNSQIRNLFGAIRAVRCLGVRRSALSLLSREYPACA